MDDSDEHGGEYECLCCKWELIWRLYEDITAKYGQRDGDEFYYGGPGGRLLILERIHEGITGQRLPPLPRSEAAAKPAPKTATKASQPKLKVVPKVRTYEQVINPMSFFRTRKKDKEPLH